MVSVTSRLSLPRVSSGEVSVSKVSFYTYLYPILFYFPLSTYFFLLLFFNYCWSSHIACITKLRQIVNEPRRYTMWIFFLCSPGKHSTLLKKEVGGMSSSLSEFDLLRPFIYANKSPPTILPPPPIPYPLFWHQSTHGVRKYPLNNAPVVKGEKCSRTGESYGKEYQQCHLVIQNENKNERKTEKMRKTKTKTNRK